MEEFMKNIIRTELNNIFEVKDNNGYCNTTKEEGIDMNRTILINVFKGCFDILRAEQKTGEKALRNLGFILTLKLLEPVIRSNEIDIETYDFDFNEEYSEDEIEKLKRCVLFSELSNEDEDNIPNLLRAIWEEILCVHPRTKDIFLHGKGFDIKYQSTFKKIFDKLNSVDFSIFDEDIRGEAYEEVIKDLMTGKILGQFFTPPEIKTLLVDLIDPKIHSDGSVETIFDPAMGTGGFLITSLRYLRKKSKRLNLKLDYKKIAEECIGGREAELDTFQIAKTNMLISSGHMFSGLEYGDSIREPIENKYDIVLANPPFGIKGFEYGEIINPLRDEYLPIMTRNAVHLFLQAIIYILKVNGRCAVVFPNGKELFSKSKEHIVVREFLLKTCDLHRIVYLPKDSFTNTSIKTCIFHFTKKCNGADVFSDVKNTKTKRTYTFKKNHKTKNVEFYDYDMVNSKYEKLISVPIEKMAEKSYSFNYSEYIEVQEVEHDDDVVIKTLGEICEFKPKSKRKASYGNKSGPYPFFTSSNICNKFCDSSDYKDECIIIGTGGSANIKYSKEFSCSTDNFVLSSRDDNIYVKYIYYYLFNSLDKLQNGFIGTGLMHISKEYIVNITIPIPSLEKQKELIEQLDLIYNEWIPSNKEKINQIKMANKMKLSIIRDSSDIKRLREVCTVKQGEYISNATKVKGDYPVYGGGNVSSYVNRHNRKDEIVIAKDGVSENCVRYVKEEFFLNHHGWTLDSKKLVDKMYLYHYLLINQNIIFDASNGTAQKGINQENFYNLEIHVPTLEKQKEVIEFCEKNDEIIQLLTGNIDNTRKLALEILG